MSSDIDLKARNSIAMHWGTFLLSDEPLFEPVEQLEQAKKEKNVPLDSFVAVKIGETKEF